MMDLSGNTVEWILGSILILSSLGVILLKKPVHACLSFLLTLMALGALYLQLSAQFISVIQVLVYAGAILVIFMFVIILFQNAYEQIERNESKSSPPLLIGAGASFLAALIYLGNQLKGLALSPALVPHDYGTVQSLGKTLYVDYFFPFEAVTVLFLVAVVGSLYIAKREG